MPSRSKCNQLHRRIHRPWKSNVMPPDATPDVNLLVKVRNARLLRAMKAVGIFTTAELARRTGLAAGQLGLFVNFRISPLRHDGEWRSEVFAISSALHREPEDLWPDHLRRAQLLRNEVQIDVTVEQLREIRDTSQALFDHKRVQELLAVLSPKQRLIIEARFGLTTRDDGAVQGDIGK